MSAEERGVLIDPFALAQGEERVHLDTFELHAQGEVRTRKVRST